MKKLGVILVVTLMVIGLAGCASSGGKSDGPVAEPYTVDLSSLVAVTVDTANKDAIGAPTGETVKNKDPFAKQYDDLMILFPEFPADIDFTAFSRITVVATCYNADGEVIKAGDGNAMVSIIEDPNGDIRGPGSEGPSKNIFQKSYNLGGTSSNISKPNGMIIKMTKAPGAILFQNSSAAVKFIEVTEITFHNGR